MNQSVSDRFNNHAIAGIVATWRALKSFFMRLTDRERASGYDWMLNSGVAYDSVAVIFNDGRLCAEPLLLRIDSNGACTLYTERGWGHTIPLVDTGTASDFITRYEALLRRGQNTSQTLSPA